MFQDKFKIQAKTKPSLHVSLVPISWEQKSLCSGEDNGEVGKGLVRNRQLKDSLPIESVIKLGSNRDVSL